MKVKEKSINFDYDIKDEELDKCYDRVISILSVIYKKTATDQKSQSSLLNRLRPIADINDHMTRLNNDRETALRANHELSLIVNLWSRECQSIGCQSEQAVREVEKTSNFVHFLWNQELDYQKFMAKAMQMDVLLATTTPTPTTTATVAEHTGAVTADGVGGVGHKDTSVANTTTSKLDIKTTDVSPPPHPSPPPPPSLTTHSEPVVKFETINSVVKNDIKLKMTIINGKTDDSQVDYQLDESVKLVDELVAKYKRHLKASRHLSFCVQVLRAINESNKKKIEDWIHNTDKQYDYHQLVADKSQV
ncbi:uncharacterized protein LOC128956640 [Oppia nitens]|uniref:uncharacterized protein LOC128956640 n=1 Tax=Oppia nitens TaxID=1686743 RepID=UPI0023DCBDD4|nr:uncharacterized protein LOC128956640 [Oppia nitens]